uniref:Uncharacterized protein n=1 Tax=Mycena chlorophos TaxID=658473 RepID=A0ABQ0LWH9_MYCCL|nr:predicted protein [Mycena chlorophos]
MFEHLATVVTGGVEHDAALLGDEEGETTSTCLWRSRARSRAGLRVSVPIMLQALFEGPKTALEVEGPKTALEVDGCHASRKRNAKLIGTHIHPTRHCLRRLPASTCFPTNPTSRRVRSRATTRSSSRSPARGMLIPLPLRQAQLNIAYNCAVQPGGLC